MRRLLTASALLLCLHAAALAGGGPETTLVVANGASPLSRRVANEYADMRDIPRSHIVLLEDVPVGTRIKLDAFLEKIWGPVARAMKEKGLTDQIDLVTYSVELPFAVDFKSVVKEKIDHRIGGFAAVNGLTYLHRQVEAGEQFWGWTTNRYFRLASDRPLSRKNLRPLTAAEQGAYQQAMQAYQQGRHEEAARAFEAFLHSYPDAAEPWYHYACCLNRTGQGKKALGALERAADLGFPNRDHAARDPDLESLRKEPRFKAVLSKFQENLSSVVYPYHPTMGFRSTVAWGDRDRYLLSTHLGWTGFKGNSVPEVLGYLRAAAGADGTKPDGTVYICRNPGVRSTAREPFFLSTVKALRALGRKVEILRSGERGQDGKLPIDKGDVIGAVIGVANFDWKKCRSRILPGAILEHLTSFGADFARPGQTKLTEFLRYGAAGSSGTVIEPLSIHLKFPNPMIHAHYAEGCSLAEAYYQSVGGPYQLMIVGDGLARPFATFVEVEPGAPPGPWKGKVELAPAGGDGIYELWVDGVRRASGAELSLDTTGLDDGHHDVRVVSVSEDRIETRSYAKVDAVVANHGKTAVPSWSPDKSVPYGETVRLTMRGAAEIQVLCGDRVVASAKGASVSVDTGGLGPGPVSLVPRAVFADGRAWRGPAARFAIEAPPVPKVKLDDLPRLPGLRGRLVTKDGEREVIFTHVGTSQTGSTIQELVKDRGVKYLELAGEIRVPRAGAYQLHVIGDGKLTAEVSGKTVAKEMAVPGQAYLFVALAEGWNPVRLRMDAGEHDRARLAVTVAGEAPYAAPAVRHGGYRAVEPKPAWKGAKEKTAKVPRDGLVVDFKRTARGVAALAVFPAPSEKEFPTEWVVEAKSGSRFKEVKNVETLVATGPKGEPAYVVLSFRPMSSKELRIRPASDARPSLARLEALGRPK